MSEIFSVENLLALLTLTSLEIVLGIDNIVFLAITTDRLPEHQKPFARRAGLALAMVERILLLCLISWMTHLTTPLFTLVGHTFSGRDLILILGGLFLIGKATVEIHNATESVKKDDLTSKVKPVASLTGVLVQVVLLDTVFSIDSIITAIGMADNLIIMVLAIVIAVLIMMVFASSLSEFILKHPTLKNLALAFLLLIGILLVGDGLGHHVDKGYIYFAIGFSALVEGLNFRFRHR